MITTNHILVVVTFVLFILTEYRPNLRYNIIITALQVLALTSLVANAFNRAFLLDSTLSNGLNLVLFLITGFLIRYLRRQ